MEQKRPSIPMQVQAFRRRHVRPRWPWALAAALVALLLIWGVSRSPDESSPQPSTPVSTAQVAGPPWQMGNAEGRFTLTLYADLECPFCREYFPQLKRWFETIRARAAVKRAFAIRVEAASAVDMRDAKVRAVLFGQRAR